MPLKQKPDADRLFRELAGRYAELEGHALRQELGSRVTPVFPPELDRRIRRSTRGGSVRRLSLGLSCAAACLLAVLALPGVFQKPGPVSPASIPAVSADTPRLPFALPARLVLMSAEQDEAKTICYLKDSLADDVILVMEPAEGPPEGDGLAERSLGGQTVYTRQTPDYQLLLLQKDGIGYTLTCRYELDHLLAIGKEILK